MQYIIFKIYLATPTGCHINVILLISTRVCGRIQIVLHGKYLYDSKLLPVGLCQKEGSFGPILESSVPQAASQPNKQNLRTPFPVMTEDCTFSRPSPGQRPARASKLWQCAGHPMAGHVQEPSLADESGMVSRESRGAGQAASKSCAHESLQDPSGRGMGRVCLAVKRVGVSGGAIDPAAQEAWTELRWPAGKELHVSFCLKALASDGSINVNWAPAGRGRKGFGGFSLCSPLLGRMQQSLSGWET